MGASSCSAPTPTRWPTGSPNCEPRAGGRRASSAARRIVRPPRPWRLSSSAPTPPFSRLEPRRRLGGRLVGSKRDVAGDAVVGGVEVDLRLQVAGEAAVAPPHLDVAVDRVLLADAAVADRRRPAHHGLARVVGEHVEPAYLIRLASVPLLGDAQPQRPLLVLAQHKVWRA